MKGSTEKSELARKRRASPAGGRKEKCEKGARSIDRAAAIDGNGGGEQGWDRNLEERSDVCARIRAHTAAAE